MASHVTALYAASNWAAAAFAQDIYSTNSGCVQHRLSQHVTCHMFCKVGFLLLQIAANIALVKNWTIHGIFWGAHQQAQPRVFRRTLEESVQWLSEGKVRVPVSHK